MLKDCARGAEVMSGTRQQSADIYTVAFGMCKVTRSSPSVVSGYLKDSRSLRTAGSLMPNGAFCSKASSQSDDFYHCLPSSHPQISESPTMAFISAGSGSFSFLNYRCFNTSTTQISPTHRIERMPDGRQWGECRSEPRDLLIGC